VRFQDGRGVLHSHVRGGGGRRSIGRHEPLVCEGQAVLIAETSNSRVILSLTRTPPVSSAAFQVMP
jgi:hypothetical protein